MREIKFRAWDEPSKSFVEDVTDLDKAKYFNQPLTQYTGLKDKNGKEIYEGDILKIDSSSRMFKVFFDERSASFKDKETSWANGYDGGDSESHLDIGVAQANSLIVGNIYENPELLGEK